MNRINSKKINDAIGRLNDPDLVLESVDFYLSFDDSITNSFDKGMDACTKALNTKSKIYQINLGDYIALLIAKDEDDALNKISNWKWLD